MTKFIDNFEKIHQKLNFIFLIVFVINTVTHGSLFWLFTAITLIFLICNLLYFTNKKRVVESMLVGALIIFILVSSIITFYAR